MFSRASSPFTPMKLLGTFVLQRWPYYVVGVLSVALTDIAQVMVPYYTGDLVDLVTGEKGVFSMQTFRPIFTSLVIATCALALLRFAWRFFLGRQTHHAAHWLKAFVYDNLRYLPEEKFQTEYSVGEVMSISTSDADYARYLFGFTMVGLLDTIFLGAFSLFMIGNTDMEVLLWCMLFFTFHPWVCKKLADRELKLFDLSQKELADLNDLAGQTVQSIRMQRMTNSGSLWTRLLNNKAEMYRQSRLRASRTSMLYTPLMGSMELVVYLIVFLVGIGKVVNGQLSIGQFVAIQSYILILQGPVIQLGFVLSDMQRARTCLKRLAVAYNEPADEIYSQTEIPRSWAPEEPLFNIENLSFGFGDHQVLKNINCQLRPGQHLGIKGEIGTGKTSLVKIMAGLVRNYQGSVKFMGKDVRTYRHKDMRHLIAMVPQNPFLFGDTIRSNIQMDREMHEDEIWHYLEMADVARDVKGLENGLDTLIGENGVTLSGGQKQRLTLARALARQPQILFLDDSLSAIDVSTEQKILDRLRTDLSEMTVIWVAHRDSTLAHCDQILHLGQARHEEKH